MSEKIQRWSRGLCNAWLICGALGAASSAGAADLVVRIDGLMESRGEVGCSLFAGAGGFPLDTAAARVQWVNADVGGVTCRFAGVPQGRYAISVGHDLNGNRRVDTNLVGLPTEAWGVSNQVRPLLRAPRFDEAAFEVAADAQERVIDIRLAR